MMQNDIMP